MYSWRDRHSIPEEQKPKRVRFNPHLEQIQPPQYPILEESDAAQKYSGPSMTKSASSLKKRRFACRNSSGLEGQLSVGGGQAIFICRHDKGQNWSVDLASVVNFESLPDSEDPLYHSLCFTLQDKSKHTFNKILKSFEAYRNLLDDAETLGFVLVVDQLLARDDLAESGAYHFADIFDAGTGKRRGAPLLGKFVCKGVQRFVTDKFNLDLSYITKRLIVMSLPVSGVSGFALNSFSQIRHFFDVRHPHAYMVYNLNTDPKCRYNAAKFEGRVRSFGFDEHSPPPLHLLLRACFDIAAFLRQSPSNVVAIHCKMGKGRSGTVACAWMLHSGLVDTAEKAVEIFTRQRMIDQSVPGIRLPSQIRYVRYIERIQKTGVPETLKAVITKIQCTGLTSKGTLQLRFDNSAQFVNVPADNSETDVTASSISLEEDVRILGFVDSKIQVFALFMHVRMLPESSISFGLADLDGERDLKGFKTLAPDFKLTLHYNLSPVVPSAIANLLAPETSQSTNTAQTLALQQQQLQQLQQQQLQQQQLADLERPVTMSNTEPGQRASMSSIERRSLRDIDPTRPSPRKIMRKPTGFIKRGTNPTSGEADGASASANPDEGAAAAEGDNNNSNNNTATNGDGENSHQIAENGTAEDVASASAVDSHNQTNASDQHTGTADNTVAPNDDSTSPAPNDDANLKPQDELTL